MAQALQGEPGISPSSKKGATVLGCSELFLLFFICKLEKAEMEPATEVRIARSTRDYSCLGQRAWEELSEERLP